VPAERAFDDLGPGSVVDRYEIVEVLRDEGAAAVFRARHLDLQREVALSVLHPEAVADDTGARDRFRESAMRLARLEHPSVAAIFSLDEALGTMWVASRLLTGPTLAEAAASGLTPARSARLVEALGDAVAAMHEAGVVHGDLRGDNVWVVRGRAPLVGPPGVRRSDGRTRTSTGLLLGSAQYLAPEQVLGEGAQEASDVFALGALAVTCLTGEPPYAERSLGRLLATRPDAPAPVLAVEGASAGAVNAALERIMAPDPADRPPPAEAARSLAAAIGALPNAVRERERAFSGASEGEAAESLAPGSRGRAGEKGARWGRPADDEGAAWQRSAGDEGEEWGRSAGDEGARSRPPVGATRVDRQRPDVEPPPVDRRGTPRWQVALAVTCALALPILCFLAGRTVAGEPESEARAGSFTVRYDGRFALTSDEPPAAARDLFDRPRVLRGPDGTTALAGALRRPGPVTDPLRGAGDSLLEDGSRRSVVALGRREAVRYDGALAGTTTRVHAAIVPTTAQPLGVVCFGPALGREAASACDALAANAGLGEARAAPARPDPRAAAALGKVLNQMHNRVELRQIELDAARPKERARVIGAVQDVYRLALEELTALRVPPRDAPVVAELSRALRRVIAGYESVVAAGDDARFAQRRAVAAVSALRRAVRSLEELGYRVTAEDPRGGA
jgi:serine/threonine-protein kinase